jgi:ATP-dependent Lon protease
MTLPGSYWVAWTSVGGDILIESLISPGGVMTITGNLGTVMKESATIALEYIKTNAKLMGLNPEIISNIIFIYMYRKEQHLKTGLVLV